MVSRHRLPASQVFAVFTLTIAFLSAAHAAQPTNFTVLYRFGGGTDGAGPQAAPVVDAQGNIYGTTIGGGGANASAQGDGVIYQITPAGLETIRSAFLGGADGAQPEGSLTPGPGGDFYGSTASGGTQGGGTIFHQPRHGQRTTLYSFTGGNDGSSPAGDMVLDSGGNLYGTTEAGGDPNCKCGTVFRLASSGALTVLHTFLGGSIDLANPVYSGLVADASGNFYGTASAGFHSTFCSNGCGGVFEVTSNGTYKVLIAFSGGTSDSASPEGGVAVNAAGHVYGTAIGGGSTECGGQGCGTVFEILPEKAGDAYREKILYRFSGGGDGALPFSRPLLQGGTIYGTAAEGGSGDTGVVFALTPKGALTVLHEFSGTDGSYPIGELATDENGNLYGTASEGGNATPGCSDVGCGTVFELHQ